ncbi:MAG: phosphate signaling complex protein PhoU [Clostridium argentinense]|uniref:Phosphate-specific transport system accessory protein PhoU n=1 Tax=Clostridium faecium TaxID=2762223 RepID=A0ABR8YQ64_9CLOT|nr:MULTISPECIES: phosphate signaling complex protein PhoU [Clostridium]MBD8046148.1 phosphate signaling complex protein PhoU [Clostridium faecium]MBS5823637.1 phosphate signaling complex protein PhoU [Clostridium argentinense]MDU1347716.1 phosphate signaling complex protein PhoU [Clostridium argentinense]
MSRKSFDTELLELQNQLSKMTLSVSEQINDTMKALINQDVNLAKEVIKKDDIIDEFENDIADNCVTLIATRQPLATDLRTIFTISKIVTDLERIADHAVDISKITLKLCDEKYIKELKDISKMGALVEEMIKGSINAYLNKSEEKALEVCNMDDQVDTLYKNIFSELLIIMAKRPEVIEQVTRLLFVCKFLERIGDHTTNICEWTIYLLSGKKIDLNE